MSTVCASEAFYKRLRNLRIEDFPCGVGPWRQAPEKAQSKFDSGGAQYDSIESLLDLEASVPYNVDVTWSKDAKSLRQIAIESPVCLQDPGFIFKHFNTLRLVDQSVDCIDEGLVNFLNLKELILTANCIERIDGRNLPKGLQVLELAANKIGDLSSLKSANLSSLLHLGLAENQVVDVSPHTFTPSIWTSLLSLDLSYNNLTDLSNTVATLKHLSSLRTLLLIGNPLHLSRCYHGVVIDSMPGLLYLDNQEITADDKHHFQSFSTLKDFDVNSSYVTFGVVGINDVKKPVQVEDADVGEFPKIEFKYHVEFEFLKDATIPEIHEHTLHINGDLATISTDNLQWAEILEFKFWKTIKVSDLTRLRSFMKSGVTFCVVSVKHSYVADDPKLFEGHPTEHDGQPCVGPEKHGNKTSTLKDPTKLDTKDGKKSAKSKSTSKAVIQKEKCGKKDKRDVTELFELAQERRIVGTCHVLMTSLLDGDTVVSVCSPCVEGSAETGNEAAGNDDSTARGDERQSGKRNDDKKKGKGDSDKHQKLMPGGKGKPKHERGKSANPVGAKGNKGGKGKEKVEDLTDVHGEDEAPPPPPLSIKLEIKLERATCTKDLLEVENSV